MSEETLNIVVTLVHGTFAQDAPWTLDSSRLCEQLRCKFVNVIIKRFKWSARNSQSARLRAGIQLKTQLKRQLEEHPSAHHFVIAHSHGGNVALYALQDDSLRQVVALACLATPFLHFTERWIHKYRERSYAFAFAILFALLLGPPAFAAGVWLHHDLVGWGIYLVGFLILKAALMLSYATAHKLFIESQVIPPLEGRLFIARVNGDEASSALGASQFLSWVLTRIASIAYVRPRTEYKQTEEHLETRADRWLRIAMILSLALLTWSWSARHGNAALVSVLLASIVCVASLPLFALAKHLSHIALFTLAFSIQAVVYGSFGTDLIFVAPWLDVTVTEAPSGYWGIHQYEKPYGFTMPQWRINPYAEYLQHSTIYEHCGVLHDLCSWMEGHLHSAPNRLSVTNSA